MNLQDFFDNETEQPLDRLLTDGGYTAIFRTIACIGDSLSSGEFEAMGDDGNRTYHDMYEYSWGQFIARMCGSKVYNFSQGGMTAKYYCEKFADERGYWNSEYAAQAYIIALGVNDVLQKIEMGTVDDIDLADRRNNGQTFAGYMGQIIQRVKEIQPRAKIFLMTMPRSADEHDGEIKVHRDIIYQLANTFDNTYVLDFYQYAPIYDSTFREKFFLHGHMNPMGYLLTAQMTASYIDYIIRHNCDDFKEVGFIGTDLHA